MEVVGWMMLVVVVVMLVVVINKAGRQVGWRHDVLLLPVDDNPRGEREREGDGGGEQREGRTPTKITHFLEIGQVGERESHVHGSRRRLEILECVCVCAQDVDTFEVHRLQGGVELPSIRSTTTTTGGGTVMTRPRMECG